MIYDAIPSSAAALVWCNDSTFGLTLVGVFIPFVFRLGIHVNLLNWSLHKFLAAKGSYEIDA